VCDACMRFSLPSSTRLFLIVPSSPSVITSKWNRFYRNWVQVALISRLALIKSSRTREEKFARNRKIKKTMIDGRFIVFVRTSRLMSRDPQQKLYFTARCHRRIAKKEIRSAVECRGDCTYGRSTWAPDTARNRVYDRSIYTYDKRNRTALVC